MSVMADVELAVQEINLTFKEKCALRQELQLFFHGERKHEVMSGCAKFLLKMYGMTGEVCPLCDTYLDKEGEEKTMYICRTCGNHWL